jgi:hypothetical protein
MGLLSRNFITNLGGLALTLYGGNELANGKMVSERQFEKMCHKAYKESFGNIPKEDKELLDDVKMSVDTTQLGN